ncbi:hypothetical protein [Frigidibacter sp. SD6-1]|uniref:hypothetical protein n=1 Tax=Frigidibacter sp. SD6-1 TaxID=3032581 RepID=UPI0024DF685C|nr:hypothetical protein [Frigidibacter sp. SD6-1]
MTEAPDVRLYLFFAQDGRSAAILRRARDRQYDLIGWDRATDRFEHGQTIRKYVVPESCALSPDGAHFLYAVRIAAPMGAVGEYYTAISRPPFFTALALFPHAGPWPLGGRFLDSATILLDDDSAQDRIGRADGLTRVIRGAVAKGCTSGLRLASGAPAPLSKAALAEAVGSGTDGAWQASQRALYDTLGGTLYRRRGLELELIRDFRMIEPQFIRAPYDWRPLDSATEAAWHPLDDRA